MTDELTTAAEKSARGGFYLISGSTIATVIMAIAAILVGRLLGSAGYGDYNQAIVIPQILLLFTDLGITTGMIKFASSSKSNVDRAQTMRILRHGMTFRIIAGIVVFAVALLLPELISATFINRGDLSFIVQIASISILFQIIFTTSTSAFVGLDKAQYNALATNVQAIGKTVASVILVLAGFGIAGAVMGYVWGYVVAGIVAGLIFLKLVRRKETDAKGSHRETFGILTKYGLPLYAYTLIAGFLPLLAQIVLGWFLIAPSEIGNYRAAQNFVTLISVVPLSITTALLPGFSELDSSAPERIRLFFKRANKYTCLLVMPIVTLLLLFSRQIVQIVYGSTFQTAWLFLSLSCISYFLVIVGYLGLTSLFNGLSDTRTTLKMALINIATFSILAPILTPELGVPGVIMSFLMASTLSTLFGGYVARKKFHIEFDFRASTRIYVVAGISAIPSVILILLHPISMTVLFVIGAVLYLTIYLTILPFSKAITLAELQTIYGIVHRIKHLNKVAEPLIGYELKILKKMKTMNSSQRS